MAYRSIDGETQRDRDRKLEASLRLERTSWEPLWRDIGDYVVPQRLRFLTTEKNRGDRRNDKIINNAAFLAWRTARSGLHAGMSSPARPWFNMTTPDPDLAEFGPVKQWLYTVTQRMRSLMLRSNLYNALPTLYGDEIGFGFGACGIFRDEGDSFAGNNNLFYCVNYDIGSYWMGVNARGRVDTFVRQIPMTVRQLVTEYGVESKSGAPKWDNFSKSVRDHWDHHDYGIYVDVMQVIAPNERHDKALFEAKYKLYRSCHYEMGCDDDTYLKESGFDYFPILAPRWERMGNDVYGRGCGTEALGDTKALQLYERRSAQAVEKMIKPSLQGPSSLKNQKVSLLSGDITFVDAREGMQGLKPIHEVRYAIDQVEAKIQRHEQRISRTFYEDLFLMLSQSDRRQITAREIEERHEEKLLALGPTLELQNQWVFDPLTDIVFDLMLHTGDGSLIPPPPQEISEMQLKTEYISILAQAQKLVGTVGVERVMGFAGNMVAVFPEIADKVNPDEALAVYAEMHGTPPKILRSEDEVAVRREQRAKAQQAQAMAEAAPGMAAGAKTLSETDIGGSNALEQLLAGVRG